MKDWQGSVLLVEVNRLVRTEKDFYRESRAMRTVLVFGLTIVATLFVPVTANAQFWPGFGQGNGTQVDFGAGNGIGASPGFSGTGWTPNPWQTGRLSANDFRYFPGWGELTGRGNADWGFGTGLGNAGYGIGAGEGRIWSGLGDYNYGTTAGLGRYWSGLGDYWWGRGEYMRGLGGYEVGSSQAAINRQEARYRDIKNDDFYAETYFNMQKRHKQVRDYNRPPPSSAEDLARYAKLRAPKRLDSGEYDASLKTVFWPAVLQDEQFRSERANLDWLFSIRKPDNSGFGTPNYQQIKVATATLREKLRARIDELEPMEYVAGKQFLDKLEFEARHPAGLSGLAMASR